MMSVARRAGRLRGSALLLSGLVALTACDNVPGRPKPSQKWQPPTANLDFKHLYAENCRGCHGSEGEISGAVPMDDPLYLALIPKDKLHEIVVSGVPDSIMPGFSEEHGGLLTGKQVDALVDGMGGWARNPPPSPLPPYSAALGNASSGQAAFGVYCASCHGQDGNGGKAGSVVNAAYLGLVTDQYLRTITIVGRRDLGCPDFQSRVPGKRMSDAEISDVVAWLVSHRKNEFGQPLTATQPPPQYPTR